MPAEKDCFAPPSVLKELTVPDAPANPTTQKKPMRVVDSPKSDPNDPAWLALLKELMLEVDAEASEKASEEKTKAFKAAEEKIKALKEKTKAMEEMEKAAEEKIKAAEEKIMASKASGTKMKDSLKEKIKAMEEKIKANEEKTKALAEIAKIRSTKLKKKVNCLKCAILSMCDGDEEAS